MAFNCPHCQKGIENVVPKDRFDEVTGELRETKGKLAESEKNAGNATKLADEVKSLKDQVKTMGGAHARELAFLQHGITDPSVREVFGMHFDRQAETGEKDPVKWLEKMVGEPDKAPSVLKSLMPAGGKGGAGAGGAKGADGAGKGGGNNWLPDTGKGAKGGVTPGATPGFTAEQIAGMSIADFKANYAAIVASNPEVASQFPAALPWGQAQGGGGKGA